jgi:hypothetical protein
MTAFYFVLYTNISFVYNVCSSILLYWQDLTAVS